MNQDPIDRLFQINSIIREMLINGAIQDTVSEAFGGTQRYRPMPERFLERRRLADQFRNERIRKNFERTEMRRDLERARSDEYRETVRQARHDQRMAELAARLSGQRQSSPSQSPPPPAPSSVGQTVTPPSARDDWYNDPKPNDMSKSSDWRRFIPQYPDPRLTTPPTQMPSSATSPPPASEQQRAGFGQVPPSELDQNTRGGTPNQTEQQRRDKNEAEMKRRMAAQGVPSDEQRLADARAEQQRRGVTPNQQSTTASQNSAAAAAASRTPDTGSQSERQDFARSSPRSRISKPAGGF